MLADIKEFVKRCRADIILAMGVILISLLSFSLGYISADYQDKTPLIFEETTNGK